MSEPTSTKPYLVRALYEWCVDNGFTPHLLVVVDSQTRVPKEHVREGKIVLNVGALATDKLRMTNDHVEFLARFGGVARELYIPMHAVAAIYARENGQGMSFEVSAPAPGEAVATPDEARHGGAVQPVLSNVPTSGDAAAPFDSAQDPPPRPPTPIGGKPGLRRVK